MADHPSPSPPNPRASLAILLFTREQGAHHYSLLLLRKATLQHFADPSQSPKTAWLLHRENKRRTQPAYLQACSDWCL